MCGLLWMWMLFACISHPQEAPVCQQQATSQPVIYPDYQGVTIPYNIAPLNFRIETVGVEACYVTVVGEKGGEPLHVWGEKQVRFPEKAWHALLAANQAALLHVQVATRTGDQWTAWKPFTMQVSDRPIDSHLVYRLIEPGYEKWHIIGIYQRDLTTFEEEPIIRNDMVGYNCMNCHSFCLGDPQQMLFHMRAAHGATYLWQAGSLQKLNTKTDQTISNLTYPAWHPSGRYVTASVNDIKQFFHAVKEKKMEVFDRASDVVVYDVKQKAILEEASIITPDAFETFPAFSPNGKWLYFCTAPAREMPAHYAEMRYHLCRVSFDAEQGSIHLPIDTLVRADRLSCTFPRISPDGRFLMYTETAYGQFPIWHTDAEIRMLDLSDGQSMDMSCLNSPDTESYHSWSSGSDWVVVSSRRDNGLYTLPYLCAIDPEGRPGKPFLVPQKNPNHYDDLLYSYNLPELVRGRVELSPYQIQQTAIQAATPVVFRAKTN